MSVVILVRHASTAWSGRRYCGRADPWLDRAGREAASRLGADLAATLNGPVTVVSSSRRRARQTARAITTAVGVATVLVDPRWDEVDVGWADGQTFDQVERRFPELAARLAAGEADIDWPGGETAAALGERVRAAWTDVLERAAAGAGPVVVVSHAGVLRIATALAAGRPIEDEPFLAPGTARWVREPVVLGSGP